MISCEHVYWYILANGSSILIYCMRTCSLRNYLSHWYWFRPGIKMETFQCVKASRRGNRSFITKLLTKGWSITNAQGLTPQAISETDREAIDLVLDQLSATPIFKCSHVGKLPMKLRKRFTRDYNSGEWIIREAEDPILKEMRILEVGNFYTGFSKELHSTAASFHTAAGKATPQWL